MKQNILHIAILTLLLVGGRRVVAQETNTAPKLDFQSFKIISQRNIFNPNRRANMPNTDIVRPKQVQVDFFTLNGTMSYEDRHYAFFEGTSSQYRKVLAPSDTIAGYKISEIGDDHVMLAASSNQVINLRVGMQMKRQDGGPWSLAASAEPIVDAGNTTPDQTPDSTSGTSAPSSAESDVIKRLMQKREQETKDPK
ncbi:MAG: hypothetical protein JWR26_2501 [Pedosphaera sp.]|nr:hypothetical protein [Pedosphaera sp.]